MDTKKLDKWAELLLDTGKRNNLINFKDTRTSTIEILLPRPDSLFEKIDGTTVFEVFDPKNIEKDEYEDIESKQLALDISEEYCESEKDVFLERYSRKIKRQNQILPYSATGNPLATLKSINKKASEFIEETGVNVAYMAFGFIHWKESDSSNCVFRAPILLVPIQLTQESAVEPFIIKSTEDDVVVNPTFSYKMDADYGVKLPEYNDEGLDNYFEKIKSLISKLNWTVSKECKIGIFSFLKINMYRDLKDNSTKILSNQNIRQLLGESTGTDFFHDFNESFTAVKNPLIELHSVVDADSSQIEAIEMAKSGKSFVLQGPPGTGKSQTITNIIAECLSDGKKILFVSEKLAALNVVYDKLKQAGLEEFCLQLHSHKSNKKDVIADICHTLRMQKSSVSSKADSEIAIKKEMQQKLDAYAIELHQPRPIIEKSIYQLYETYASVRSMPDVEYVIPQIPSVGDAYLNETVSLLEQYVDYIPSVGYDYGKNPWFGYINQDTSYQAKDEVKKNLSVILQFLQVLVPLAQEVSEKYEIQCSNIKEAHLWDNFFKFAATSKLITPSLLARDNFDMVNSVLKKLQAKSADILNVSSSLAKAFDGDVYKLDGAAYHKKLTKQFIGKASRIFSSEYKHIVKELRFCKKDGRKPSYREAVDTMGKLAQYQQKCAEFSELESKIKTYLGKCYVGIDTDWDNVLKQMDELNVIISYPLRLGKLEKYDSFDFEQQAFAEYHKNFESIFKSCSDDILNQIAGYFDLHILDIKLTPSLLVEKRLENCLAEMNKLENWCHFMTLLSKLNDKQVVPYIRAVIAQNIEAKDIVGAFKKQFYYQWIYSILSENQVLSSFDRIRQDNVRKTFAEKDIEQFEINKAKIRERLSSLRPSLDMVAQGSPLSILLREGGKKRKQKSIRHLLSETGELVQRIKPCFLMSPLSVSTFLASDSIHFDTVIFDEASQIFPQDAIGAIYRADQLIVVGDSKQMPPSNFFNTTIESDDEETDDVTSFESILDLCSASMQQHRLCWHYRSRYEQLIAFSNKNFYDNDLITFPSSKAKDFGIGIDYYHVDGVFDRKAHVNRKEAEFIVDLIYRNIEEYPERSLGVVAFSIAQQDLIDKLLSKRRQETPEKEFFFRKDNREAFFIKNLETVQGDERDTIIFSIAYGVDSQGRFSHNFGPLNRLGGERRLNVAVTRAKINLQVVSSMHYTNIDLAKTSADGAKLLREYLDYAENGNIALERSLSVNKFEQFDSDFELEVCEFLKGRGFSVDTQVGCSGFRIDIGLKRPNSSDYVLAIECDGATYHSAKNARDRDRLRQDILERMGWKFYRIWSTDWFRNKAVEQQRLFDAAVKAVTNTEREEVLQKNSPSAEPFENIMPEKHFEFPVYKFADIDILSKQYSQDFKGMIKAILEIEAPLSEEFLLKRIAPLFGREKVTNFVYEIYKQKMFGYQCYDIIRENGFLYLKNGKDIQFRCAGDDGKRDIKQIAPEELAAGMFEILKQNVSADKNGLYHDLAIQCGVTRTGKAINETMDSALNLLIRKGKVILDDGRISIR